MERHQRTVLAAHEALQRAEERYRAALRDAYSCGETYVSLGELVGVSRMTIKRLMMTDPERDDERARDVERKREAA